MLVGVVYSTFCCRFDSTNKQTMKTEIQQLTEAWSSYTTPKSTAAFYKAEKVLLKFHAKYGTIDIPTIKQLIR